MGSNGIVKTHWTLSPKKRAMLAGIRETGNVTEAAKAAQVRRKSHYGWIERDPEYAEAARDAFDQAGDVLEAEARRRAVEGVAEPVFYQGVAVGAVRKYSDVLLIFLLKGVRPEKFRERHDHKLQGNIGFTLESAIARLDTNAESEF